MLPFERLELVQQMVERLVGNLRGVEDVVLLFVMPDGLAKFPQPRFGRLRDGQRSRERTKSGSARSASRSALGGNA